MKRSTFFKSIIASIAIFLGYKAKANPWSSKLTPAKDGPVIKCYADGRIEADFPMYSTQSGSHWPGDEPVFKAYNNEPFHVVMRTKEEIAAMKTKEYKWIEGNTYEYIRDL